MELQELLSYPDIAIQIFESYPDAVVIVAEDGKIKIANQQSEFLSGYHRSELKGNYVEMLLPDMLQEKHVAHRKRFMQEPKMRPMGYDINLVLKKKNGETVPVAINLSPISTHLGIMIIAVIRKKDADK